MKTKPSIFLILFLISSFTHLSAIAFDYEILGFYTKPLLISSLAFWFYTSVNSTSSASRRFFLIGLVFSVIGDILLMLVKSKGELFFLLGLGSFLLAHLSYIIAFFRYPKFKSGIIWKQKWLVSPFVIVLIAILFFLWNGLGAFKIPVVIYSATIITMSIFCLNLKNRMPKVSWQIIFTGAVFFVLSDLTIAIKKFQYPAMSEDWSGLAIMSTYILGQFLLTAGMASSLLSNEKKLN